MNTSRTPGAPPQEVQAHGGRWIALRQASARPPRATSSRSMVLILVEWDSKEAFASYRSDPKLADLHPHRDNGSAGYVWHLFDRLDDLRPLLK